MTCLAYSAYRRVGDPSLRLLAVGFAFLDVGVRLACVTFELLGVGILVESLFVFADFSVIAYLVTRAVVATGFR